MSETSTVERPAVLIVGISVEELFRTMKILGSEMEVGTIDRFVIYKSQAPDQIQVFAAPTLTRPVHGPQRKGRGGKVRRW